MSMFSPLHKSLFPPTSRHGNTPLIKAHFGLSAMRRSSCTRASDSCNRSCALRVKQHRVSDECTRALRSMLGALPMACLDLHCDGVLPAAVLPAAAKPSARLCLDEAALSPQSTRELASNRTRHSLVEFVL